VPEKWSQLKDIAEFFTRPEEGLYGLSMWSEKYYDAMTMNFERILWAYGGDIGHSQTYSVKGILNSDEGIEALKFRKDLQKFNPPNWSNSYFTEANNAFSEGKVAITENFFAFFPDLIDKTKNPYSEVTGFFANPEGPKGRFASLGGQGLSVIGYSKKKDLTFKYLEWFAREDVQEKWAELGGYTCNVNVLNSQKFLSATPYNPAFKESMGMIKDFWSVPEYAELLAVSQKYLNLYVTTDEITAEHALSSIADEWESIFENGGYYKE
jgi:multiple sugar transport system substrate-binding protein